MGMTFENNNLTPEEQREQEKLELERAKARDAEPSYFSLGSIYSNGERILLLVGEDKKWYKAPYLKDIQASPFRNSPKNPSFDLKNIQPFTKQEFDSYFKQK